MSAQPTEAAQQAAVVRDLLDPAVPQSRICSDLALALCVDALLLRLAALGIRVLKVVQPRTHEEPAGEQMARNNSVYCGSEAGPLSRVAS